MTAIYNKHWSVRTSSSQFPLQEKEWLVISVCKVYNLALLKTSASLHTSFICLSISGATPSLYVAFDDVTKATDPSPRLPMTRPAPTTLGPYLFQTRNKRRRGKYYDEKGKLRLNENKGTKPKEVSKGEELTIYIQTSKQTPHCPLWDKAEYSCAAPVILVRLTKVWDYSLNVQSQYSKSYPGPVCI